MTNNKEKLSFWDSPPWVEKFDSFRYACSWYVGLPGLVIAEACKGRWAESYGITVLYIAFLIAQIIKKKNKNKGLPNKRSHYFTPAVVIVVFESIGFAIFGLNLKSNNTKYLIGITVVAIVYLVTTILMNMRRNSIIRPGTP